MENKQFYGNGDGKLIREDILSALREIGVVAPDGGDEEFDKTVDEMVTLFNGNNIDEYLYSRQDVMFEMPRMKRVLIMLKPEVKEPTIKDIKEGFDKIDMVTVHTLLELYYMFYRTYQHELPSIVRNENDNEDEIESVLRLACSRVFNRSKKTELDHVDISLRRLFDVVLDYSFLAYKLPPAIIDEKTGKQHRPADSILLKMTNSHYFDIDKKKEDKIERIIDTLIDENVMGYNAFSPEELEKLLNKTISILTESSARKIKDADYIIHDYAEYLNMNADEEFQRLVDDNITLKALALKSGSFLTTTTERQRENYRLLTGSTLSQVDSTVKFASVVDDVRYRNVKLNINPHQLYHILTQNTAVLSHLSSSKVLSMSKDFDKVISRVFEGRKPSRRFKKEDFDVESFLTGNNIIALLQLSKDDKPQNEKYRESLFTRMVANINTLSEIMGSKSVFKIMQNNIAILNMDNELLRSQLAKLREECGQDIELLTEKVNEFVNAEIPLFPSKNVYTCKPRNMQTTNGPTINTNLEDVKDDFSAFEISLDMGKYTIEKLSTKLSKATVGECFELLYREIDFIEGELQNQVHDDSESVIRLAVARSKQIIKKAEELIEVAEEENVFVADSMRRTLNKIKTEMFANIVKFCKVKKREIADVQSITDFVRNKRVHNDAKHTPGTIAYFVDKTKESAKILDDEGARLDAYEMADCYRLLHRQRHAEEQKSANAERMERYNNAVNNIGNYSLYATTEHAIESMVLGD